MQRAVLHVAHLVNSFVQGIRTIRMVSKIPPRGVKVFEARRDSLGRGLANGGRVADSLGRGRDGVMSHGEFPLRGVDEENGPYNLLVRGVATKDVVGVSWARGVSGAKRIAGNGLRTGRREKWAGT